MLGKETKFDPTLVTDLITKVKGKSSLAALCGQTPIPFNGLKEFIFSMDNEIDIVAENGYQTVRELHDKSGGAEAYNVFCFDQTGFPLSRAQQPHLIFRAPV